MTPFWSAWIRFLVVLNMGITLFLFVFALRVKIPTQPDGTTGHVWGSIREGVRNLPVWWAAFSACLFAVGFSYLALYPGFGGSRGLLGWTSHGQLVQAAAVNDRKLDPLMHGYLSQSVEQLAGDATATQIGQRLFIDDCAACHGREARGNQLLGAPNLTDAVWLYGGDGQTILNSIMNGRHGTMPAFIAAFGESGVDNLANYVLSLSNAPHDATKAAAGKALFVVCSACHGPAGKGNPILGAPNLTDKVWLFGGDLATVEETIRHGRSGDMPAWRTRLDASQMRVIAAWVFAQSHNHAVAMR
jgi:cytochrome c oxidase cbb3-type subunit III